MWGGTDALSALLRDTLGTGELLLFLALELLITSLHHGAFLLLFFLLFSPFVCRLPPVPLHSQFLLHLFLLNVFFHLSFFLSKQTVSSSACLSQHWRQSPAPHLSQSIPANCLQKVAQYPG